jgi:hypothetical protein
MVMSYASGVPKTAGRHPFAAFRACFVSDSVELQGDGSDISGGRCVILPAAQYLQ